MAILAILVALAACASPNLTHPVPPAPTVPAETGLPQAPPALPTRPVTETPLEPQSQVPVSTGPLKIGLLLPLSGNGAAVGTEMLNAAQMALFDLGEDRFQLLPRDTKGSPAEAAEATRRLISGGARLVLGPLFSTEVTAVKPVAQAAGVNVLAFSNDWTRAGDGIYIIGLVPADQVARIVGFTQMRGLARLAVLAPRDPYGDAVVAAVRETARRVGVTVTREERYGKNNAEMATAVTRLASASPLEDEKRQLAGRTDEASRAALARLEAQPAPADSSFDALLIAEGGDRLKALVPMLAAHGIDSAHVRLLGTGLWDDPAIGRLPGLAGAWYAAPAPETRADFESRFEALYHHRPQRLATLAYDATALAAVLAKSPATSGFGAAALTNPSGFAGIDGIFRLRNDGLVERGLAVIEIGPDGPRVIDQAPASFEALTN
jgi:ABC-type branched-subunit amino acid transport system substrate-binding protein